MRSMEPMPIPPAEGKPGEAPGGAAGAPQPALTRRAALGVLAVAAVCAMPALAGCSADMAATGAVAKSVLDRLTPGSYVTMWAFAPEPASYTASYGDATGAGANYVYEVDAADEEGNRRTLTLIYFGRKAPGEGCLKIDAKGGSGVRYREVDAADVPSGALEALG